MLEYRKVQRTPIIQTTQRRTISIPSKSARSLSKGMSRLNALVKSASTESILSDSEAVQSVINLERDAEDRAAVDREFNQWLGSGIITNEKELEEFDLVRYWQVFGTSAISTVQHSG
jgi:hypothetical protein